MLGYHRVSDFLCTFLCLSRSPPLLLPLPISCPPVLALPTPPSSPPSPPLWALRSLGMDPVLDKGQVVTGYYRWLQRAGGFVWLQSVATVAGNGKSAGEHHVLWVSHVLR